MVKRGGASAYDTPELLIKTEDRVEKTETKFLMDFMLTFCEFLIYI